MLDNRLFALSLVTMLTGCSFGPLVKRQSELNCPTDIRKTVPWCAGEDAVFRCPCGPQGAFYGHKPTCWRKWPMPATVWRDAGCGPIVHDAPTLAPTDEQVIPLPPVTPEAAPAEADDVDPEVLPLNAPRPEDLGTLDSNGAALNLDATTRPAEQSEVASTRSPTQMQAEPGSTAASRQRPRRGAEGKPLHPDQQQAEGRPKTAVSTDEPPATRTSPVLPVSLINPADQSVKAASAVNNATTMATPGGGSRGSR
jgi:hypothetical protein